MAGSSGKAAPGKPPARRNSTAASAALFDRALNVLPGGNTRLTAVMEPFAPYLVRGDGAVVHDADGNEYLDFNNNFFSLVHGHAHPAIVEALQRTLTGGTSFGLPTESEILLAEEICGRSRALQSIRFCNSGTEAVMGAIKAARAHTGRAMIAKFEGAYHGGYDHIEVSLDSTPKNWGGKEPAAIAYAAGTPPAVLQDTIVLPYNDIETTTALIERNRDELAAVVFDPLPSRVGMVPAGPAFLKALRETTRRHGIMLLFDEVITFRLGYHGAHTLIGVEPDIVALGKVIGGGLPVGAVAGRKDVMEVFNARGRKAKLPAGGTFTANPLTMAAGLACMKLLQQPMYEKLDRLGARLRDGVGAQFRKRGMPGQATGMGSLFRIHLTDRKITDYRSSYPSDDDKARLARLHRWLMDNGMLLTPNLSGALSTPMTEADIDRFLATFGEALEACG